MKILRKRWIIAIKKSASNVLNILNVLNVAKKVFNSAVDFIISQQAEIERLKGYNENLQAANTALSNEIIEIKSEAVKEFAERLKEIVKFTDDTYECWEIEGYIDNLLKEMVDNEKET